MGIDLALQHLQPRGVQTFLHLHLLQLLLVEKLGHLVVLLQGVDIPLRGVLHLVEGADQFPHLIFIFNGYVLAAEIISGDLSGSVGQLDQRIDQGAGQQLRQT